MADEPGFGHTIVLGGAAVLGGLSLFGIYFSWVPQYTAVYRDLSMELPALTIWMLQLADLTAKFWFAILPIVILGPIPPALLMGRGKGQRILAHMAVIQLLVALFTIVALSLPMHKIGAHLRETAPAGRPVHGVTGPTASAPSASPAPASPAPSSPSAAPR